MKGKSLSELAKEVERQAATKRDFISPAPRLHMQDGNALLLDVHRFGINDNAHNQIAERLSIPKPYYDRCRANSPTLLTENVNYWLTTNPNKYMVRTLDGDVRALLSDRYRPLDNYDLCEAVLPIISDKQWTIRDCEVTERKLYIKIVSMELQAVTRRIHGVDQVVHPGLVISNSEIGMGAVRITPSLHWPHCFNIAMMDSVGTSRFHAGRKDERFGELAAEFFKDSTRELDDRAFWSKVRDVVSATVNQGLFEMLVKKFEEAADAKVDGDPYKVVELATKKYGVNETERKSILRHFIEDADLTLHGLSQAITRAAQDVDSYDRGVEMERLGGEIIELDRHEWKELQAA